MKKLILPIMLATSILSHQSFADSDLFCPSVITCMGTNWDSCVITGGVKSLWLMNDESAKNLAPGTFIFGSAARARTGPYGGDAQCSYYREPGYAVTIRYWWWVLNADTSYGGNKWKDVGVGQVCDSENINDCPFVPSPP